MTVMSGAISWFEIAASKAESAQEFYGRLFGWKFTPNAAGTYVEITTSAGPRPSGGLMPTQGQMPSYATICVQVNDVAATMGKATARGGRVIAGPIVAGEAQDMVVAYLLDPQGAMTCIWSSAAVEEIAPYGSGAGDVGWFEIGVADTAAARAYYADLFGWTFNAPGPTDYHVVSTGNGHVLEGGVTSNERAPYAVFFVAVPDVDDAVAAAERAGGKLLAGPMLTGAGLPKAYLLDPEGSQFGVFAATPA